MAEQRDTAASVEAYLRALASGEPVDVGVREPDEAGDDEALAQQLEARLAAVRRYVRHKDDAKPLDFYVGRPTLWGNSFRLPKGGGTDADRRRVVLQYARQFAARSEAQRWMMLAQMRTVIRRGGKLVCWCAPKLCHAQVLAYWAIFGADPLAGPGATERHGRPE